MLTDSEREGMPGSATLRERHLPASWVPQLVSERATETPDALAVASAKQELTYRELDTRANQLAHELRTFGVGPEVVVGLCVNSSLEFVVGALAILKAGGAYLPLDPSYPPERLAFILSDARCPLAVTTPCVADLVVAGVPRVVYVDLDGPGSSI